MPEFQLYRGPDNTPFYVDPGKVDRITEEVESNIGYPASYKPRGVSEQITKLRELFPELGTADIKIADGPLPEDAEAWFVIPHWHALGYTYNEVVQRVIDLIVQTRKVDHNGLKHSWDRNHLRQKSCSEEYFGRLARQQRGHNIHIIGAQFGMKHRGRSLLRAGRAFLKNEFGLGMVAAGAMLLTHPERLQPSEWSLDILCPGDEMISSPRGSLDPEVPCLYSRHSRTGITIDDQNVKQADSWFGFTTGFLPE